jgi:hypothetical protein
LNSAIAEEQALPTVLRICRLRVASPTTRELLVFPASLDFVTQVEATATMASLDGRHFATTIKIGLIYSGSKYQVDANPKTTECLTCDARPTEKHEICSRDYIISSVLFYF